jgi:hypothetical protein
MWAALALVVVSTASHDFVPQAPQDESVTGLARIRQDAARLAGMATTNISKQFLAATSGMPPIATRTLYVDADRKVYRSEQEANRLSHAERDALRKITADETLYYNTKYGSPLAYLLPLEILGRAGLADLGDRKILDFGYGGVGPLRLIAAQGATAVGVDVDPLLPALYCAPSDQGVVSAGPNRKGQITLVDGHFPSDPAVIAKVGAGYDVFVAKNTLKRGYVHPERPTDKQRLINLGVTDAEFVRTIFNLLKPGGFVLIYNLCPAPSPADKPFLPAADGRSAFSRATWETAGFRVLAFDRDDSSAARSLARALGWDRGEGAMNPEKDLFATYTLVAKPMTPS